MSSWVMGPADDSFSCPICGGEVIARMSRWDLDSAEIEFRCRSCDRAVYERVALDAQDAFDEAERRFTDMLDRIEAR